MAMVKVPPSPDYGIEIDDGARVETAAPNARQAVTGHNVRYVLALGLAGAAFILAVIYFLFVVN